MKFSKSIKPVHVPGNIKEEEMTLPNAVEEVVS